jgi:hypothetical protein
MKRVLLLALSIPLLSIAISAQTLSSTPTTNDNQASPSPLPSPTLVSKGFPDLPAVVEGLASAVMLASVIGTLYIILRMQNLRGLSVTPRHIQFVSVCLIVPTILILGLEKVLTSETSATLIGGLAGYLLSGLGKYEPPKPPPPETSASQSRSPTPSPSTLSSEPLTKQSVEIPGVGPPLTR